MLYKNLPTNKIVPIIFSRLIMDGLSGLLALTQGRFKDIVAIIKAHWAFIFGIPKWKKKRKLLNTVQSNLHLNSLDGFYDKSVVWQYFVKGIKSFEKLKIPVKKR